VTEYVVPPVQVPGWTAALAAIDAENEPGEWQRFIRPVTVALAAATPHIRAETLADLADELVDHFPDVAEILDHASHDIRKAITR
jgi:hypothetical protein